MRFALCNELFQGVPLRQVCQTIHKLGYAGIEIAPFTLADDVQTLDRVARKEISSTIAESGLSFVGLHWILVSPQGLHVTSSDQQIRKRSWNYVGQLIDLCADLATDDQPGVIVFGSPKQRSTYGEMSCEQATEIFIQELSKLASHAVERGIQILVEALPANQSDVINSMAEAVGIVDQIGSPAIQSMFDVHNAIDETMPHTDLIKQYFPYIRHVHVNELDGREPGAGNYNFSPLLGTLDALDYNGWVSVEAFNFTRDPEEVANRAIHCLRSALPSATIAKTI